MLGVNKLFSYPVDLMSNAQYLRRSFMAFLGGYDRHAAVQHNASALPIAYVTKPLRIRVGAVVEAGAILNEEDYRCCSGTSLQNGLPAVRLDQSLVCHILLIQKTIGRFELLPAVGLLWQRSPGPFDYFPAKYNRPPAPSPVSEICLSPLRLRPFFSIYYVHSHILVLFENVGNDKTPETGPQE